ncbi:MAG: hypothetical protein HETSPECPRED_000381 [Heterodermia speciosa]|uniref:Uncharacterized protein n=1 Tax=Heterodermia speciosa TaxID=116794 RepID=A0A8H3ETV2_9LECA|nr:MAG: hypothetical protein HETSPECPRED_000381 [Heterodermia speciosa]
MSSSRAAPSCVPTWRGHIETTKDALIIFEAALQGLLAHCIRRPHDRERNSLIVSGNVFVYEEGTSGIKRWTDGIPWSPSRILTNFLIYRQLNSPFPPGEKKRATKRSQRPMRTGEPYATASSNGNGHDDGYHLANLSLSGPGLKSEESGDKDADRVLVGSLVDSYEFKEGGLLKKTMTVTVNGVQHHLVSYYSLEDAKYNLRTPREDVQLKDILLREELTNQPKFKVQNYDDAGDGAFEQVDTQQSTYPFLRNGLQTSGIFSPTAHSHFSQQDQSPSVYYPAYAPYASQVHTPTSMSNVGFASLPATPSTYAPLITSPTAYPPYVHHPSPQHQNQHQVQPQPPRRSSNHAYVKPEPQSQFHSQIQQQPQYQPSSQYHQLSHHEQKPVPQSSFSQQSPTETTARRDGVVNMYTGTPDSLGMSNGYYSQGGNVGSSISEASLLLPQPLNMPFSTNYGGNTENYYTSRATS